MSSNRNLLSIFIVVTALLLGYITVQLSTFDISLSLITPIGLLIIIVSLLKKLYIELFLGSFFIGHLVFMGIEAQFIIIAFLCFIVIISFRKIIIDRYNLSIIIYITLITALVMFSDSMENSLNYLLSGLLSSFIYFFGVIQFKDFNRVKRYVFLISLLLTIISVLAIIELLKWNAFNSSYLGVGRLNTLLGRSNAYAGLLTMILPVVMSFGLIQKKKARLVYLLIISILIISLLLTASKGGILTFILQIVMMGFIVITKYKAHNLLKIIVIAGLFLSIIYLSFMDYFQSYFAFISIRFSDITNVDSTIERLEIWKSAIKLFGDNILFGVGIGNFSYYYPEFKHVHNLYLETLVEGGIIGFILFVYFVVGLISRCYNLLTSKNTTFSFIGVGLFCSLTGVLINNTFEPLHSSFMLSGYSYGWFFWIIVSIIYSLSKLEGEKDDKL